MRSVPGTILVKGILTIGIFEAMLPFVGRVAPLAALWLALAVAVLTYAVADRLVLAGRNNAAAVLADFAIAVAALYLLARVTPGVRLPFGGALAVGGALSVAEIVYHQFLLNKGVGAR